MIVAIPDKHAIFVLFRVDAPYDLAFLKSFLPLSHLLSFFGLFVAIVTVRVLTFGTLAWQVFLFFNFDAIVLDNMTVTDNRANQSVVWSCFRTLLRKESAELFVSLKVVYHNFDILDVLWCVFLSLYVEVLLIKFTNVTFNDF